MKRRARLLSSTIVTSVILTLLLAGVVLAVAVVVDTFSDGAQIREAWSGNSPVSGSNTGSMIGGERDTRVTWVSGLGTVKVEIDFLNSNFLAFSQGPGVTGNVLLQWDGIDNSMDLQYTAGPWDLTDGGLNDVMVLRVIANDNPVGITLRVYSSSANWSQYTVNTPGGVPFGTVVDIVIPFTSFGIGGGTGANFVSVVAAEMILNGTLNEGADVSVDFCEANALRDFGDLPTGYPVTLANDGARHIAQGLRLGASVDAEADGTNSANADNDDTDATPDDEDGVVRTAGWNWSVGAPPGNGGRVDVTVNGCSGTCYLNGWINWNTTGASSDTDFADGGERIFTDQPVSNGTQTLPFSIPAGVTFANTFDARFRLCATTGTCTTVTGQVTNGEVEDYRWGFGPNAVTLRNLEARPSGLGWAALALVAASLLVGGMILLTLARRRKA